MSLDPVFDRENRTVPVTFVVKFSGEHQTYQRLPPPDGPVSVEALAAQRQDWKPTREDRKTLVGFRFYTALELPGRPERVPCLLTDPSPMTFFGILQNVELTAVHCNALDGRKPGDPGFDTLQELPRGSVIIWYSGRAMLHVLLEGERVLSPCMEHDPFDYDVHRYPTQQAG